MSAKERVGMKDNITVVLNKADGTKISNVLDTPITNDMLKKVIKDMGLDVQDE